MNILHVVSSVFKAGGGTSEVVPRLCRALQENGHTVTLAVVDFGEVSDTAKDAVKAGVRIVQFPRLKFLCSLALSPAMRRGLLDLVSDADIVHLHGLWQAPCWYAAAECRRQHKPYVMMPHGFLEPERLKISKWKKRIVGALFDRRYLKAANALVATAPSEAEGFRKYGLTNPVHIMPIGLDLESFKSKGGEESKLEVEERRDSTLQLQLPTTTKPKSPSALQLQLPTTTKKKLLYFSRITPIKGLDMLAEAWKRLERFHNDWELVIAGPDDRGYTRELQRYMTSIGLSYRDESKSIVEVEERTGSALQLQLPTTTKLPSPTITFTGPVYGDAKFAMLRSADAFVLPTRSENWSIAMAEAMAMGLPVVCTKGAPWGCVAECGAGEWVDVSVEAVGAGLERILGVDDDRRAQMGLNGRRWVQTHLAWPRIANDMVNFYAYLG